MEPFRQIIAGIIVGLNPDDASEMGVFCLSSFLTPKNS